MTQNLAGPSGEGVAAAAAVVSASEGLVDDGTVVPPGEAAAVGCSAAGGEDVAVPGPDSRQRGARFGVLAWLRWGWRQLTSMRTALVLLFLLALASIPGSVLPQQGIDPAAVTAYYVAHPALAPFLARLSGFDVFGAPWFAAIYLLLFTSLAGCVLPRTFRLARSARQPPPQAPRNLGRLPHAAGFETAAPPDLTLESAAALLKRRRFRVRTGAGWVSAEKGYLHEIGNLLFHVALLGLLVSVALGGLFGYKGNRLLVEGDTFANTPVGLDVFRPGRLVTAGDLAPFSVTLKKFSASYIASGDQRGQPSKFVASVRYNSRYGGPMRSYRLQVNHPLVVDGVRVFLIGHGYAPVFKVTDGTGAVRLDQPVPFIPVEQSGLTSAGVVKVPDAHPRQLGFAGVFLPTEIDVRGRLASAFPAAEYPRVSLVSYAGNLGMGSGQPQSVYSLDTSRMRRLAVRPRPLAPGQSITLPNGLGKLTFTGYRQWVSLAITYDPGQLPALVSAMAALCGLILSFLVRRRRIFVRAAAAGLTPPGQAARAGAAAGRETEATCQPNGSESLAGREARDRAVTQVAVGGLTRSDAAGGFETEFAELATEIMQEVRGHASAASRSAGAGDAEGSGGSSTRADSVAQAAGSKGE
jgi:cytochrome c biogenesis protein